MIVSHFKQRSPTFIQFHTCEIRVSDINLTDSLNSKFILNFTIHYETHEENRPTPG